jgi:hypothetical protein
LVLTSKFALVGSILSAICFYSFFCTKFLRFVSLIWRFFSKSGKQTRNEK